MLSAALEELETWARGLFGDRLAAALTYVRGARQSGELGTKVQPRVEAYAETLEALKLATNRYLFTALPLSKDNPDLADRAKRVSAAYQLLYTQWYEPESVRRASAADQAAVQIRGHVGIAASTAAVVIITVAGVAWAVTEVGAAYAVAAQGDAERALAQLRLQEQELAARVKASKDGRTLPPSTLALPNPAPVSGTDMGKAMKAAAGLAVLALGVGAVASFWPRGRS